MALPHTGPDSGYTVRSSREIYNGKVVRLRVDEVEMPTGAVAVREVAAHPGGVGVVALDEHNRVCLISQYRHPVGERLLEVPAGLRDVDGEAPETTAARELEEEVGLRPGRVERLCRMAVSPGFTDEIVEIFLARDLESVPLPEREDEEAGIEICWLDLDEAIAMIDAGTLVHGIAVAGIQATWRRLRR